MNRCLHPDTQLLLYLGGMKAAKNVIRGDVLMGDDNSPRIVLAGNSGYDQLYRVIPEIGEPFVITDSHVLSLYNEHTDKITDISLEKYMAKSPLWKIKHKLYSKPVEYPQQPIKNDPYMVGILLAGEKKSIDDVIKEYLSKVLDSVAYNVSANRHVRTLDTIDKDEIEYLLNYKYIPDEYLYNTREIRLNLLKGFYAAATYVEKPDKKITRSISQPVLKSRPVKKTTQGRVSFNVPDTAVKKKKPKRAASHASHRNSRTKKPIKKPPNSSKSKILKPIIPKKTTKIESNTLKPRKSRMATHQSNVIGAKSKSLKIKDKILNEQLKFLIRSLGYVCIQIGESLIIQSDLKEEILPMHTINQASFTIVHHDISNYVGFTLDGNGRFLLSSCVVSHNGL